MLGIAYEAGKEAATEDARGTVKESVKKVSQQAQASEKLEAENAKLAEDNEKNKGNT